MFCYRKPLKDLFKSQIQTEKEIYFKITHALQYLLQSQRDHPNESPIDDVSSFNGKPELYFDWMLKL